MDIKAQSDFVLIWPCKFCVHVGIETDIEFNWKSEIDLEKIGSGQTVLFLFCGDSLHLTLQKNAKPAIWIFDAFFCCYHNILREA